MPGFFDWHRQKTFQCSNTHLIENQKLANLGIIRIQSQNTPQNSCKKQLIVWIILITTVFHHQFINMKSIKYNEKSALDNEMK